MLRERMLRTVVEIPMRGFVDLVAVGRAMKLLQRVMRRRPCTKFLLNCAEVDDFSDYALARITRLRQELQWRGSDVALTQCTDHVKSRLAVPLFESLVLAPLSRRPGDSAPLNSLNFQQPGRAPGQPGGNG